MPKFAAPGVGRQSTHVIIEADMETSASGGLALYMNKGYLVYEYNMMIIENYLAKSIRPLAAGRYTIEFATDIKGPGQAGTVTLMVDGQSVGQTDLKRTVPAAFTATETFDVGVDLGSPVSYPISTAARSLLVERSMM